MVSTPSESNWPVTFPGNLRWSNAMQIVKGMVAYGAAAMAEIDLIATRLKARAAESDLDRAWMEEWSKEADRVAKIGDEADAAGNAITAGNQYMRAGNYYYSAERFIAAGRGEARDVSQGAALLPGRHGAPASRHRAGRGAL